jgi:hypothetical protein
MCSLLLSINPYKLVEYRPVVGLPFVDLCLPFFAHPCKMVGLVPAFFCLLWYRNKNSVHLSLSHILQTKRGLSGHIFIASHPGLWIRNDLFRIRLRIRLLREIRFRIRILFRIRQRWPPPREICTANSHCIHEITMIYKVF